MCLNLNELNVMFIMNIMNHVCSCLQC